MKVRLKINHSSDYLVELEDAQTIMGILVDSEVFSGWGDNLTLKPNTQDIEITSVSEAQLKKIRGRQVLETQ